MMKEDFRSNIFRGIKVLVFNESVFQKTLDDLSN